MNRSLSPPRCAFAHIVRRSRKRSHKVLRSGRLADLLESWMARSRRDAEDGGRDRAGAQRRAPVREASLAVKHEETVVA